MAKFIKVSIGSLIWLAISIYTGGMAYAEPDRREGGLVLEIVNHANVSDGVLLKTKAHFERIFNRTGIGIEWENGNGLKLTVILLPESQTAAFDPMHAG